MSIEDWLNDYCETAGRGVNWLARPCGTIHTCADWVFIRVVALVVLFVCFPFWLLGKVRQWIQG